MTQSRTFKRPSYALAAFYGRGIPGIEYDSGSKKGTTIESYPSLWVADNQGEPDAYYIMEMEDGSFFADCNFLNKDRKPPSASDVAAKLVNLFDEAALMGVRDLDSLMEQKANNYTGSYFKTIDEAYSAICEWRNGGDLPKCYNRPIYD